MLTLVCGVVLASAVYVVTVLVCGSAWGWGLTFAILCILAVNIISALILKRVSSGINNSIQGIMMETRRKIEVMQNQFMRRPGGNQKQIMAALMKKQDEGLRLCLLECDKFKKLYLWSPLLKKQTNSMRALFHFQLKEFNKTDELLKECLMMDPQLITIKLVRMYKNGEKAEAIDKFFRKKGAGLRGENCILPVAFYTWYLVKENRISDAVKVLVDAKKKTDNETLHANWEALVNNQVRKFSNAGLGELWYAFGLEEMKMPKVRQQYQYRR